MPLAMSYGSVAPPPGLDAFDEMMPLKVELPSGMSPCHVTQMSLRGAGHSRQPWAKDHMEPGFATSISSGEWVSRVNNVAPYLNTQGLHRAMAILDQATHNVQQDQALKDAIACAQVGQGSLPYFHCAATCTMWQAQLQLHEQQQRLLADLQRLTLDPASLRDQSMGGTVDKGSFEERHSKGKALDRSKAQPTANSRKVQTLSTSLQLLSDEDPDCLFIVRRINKLGFKAVRTLKRHFSLQGPVVKVLLAHSTVRQHGDPACHARRRPSSLGFVQMGNTEAAAKVLALGLEQEVDGVMIRVQRFERQRDMDIGEEVEDSTDDPTLVMDEKIKYERCVSEESASTSASPFTSPSMTHSMVEGADVESEHDLDC